MFFYQSWLEVPIGVYSEKSPSVERNQRQFVVRNLTTTYTMSFTIKIPSFSINHGQGYQSEYIARNLRGYSEIDSSSYSKINDDEYYVVYD